MEQIEYGIGAFMTEHAPSTRKNAETTRGKLFEPSNSGRTKGLRNKVTLALEALLDGEAEALTRKAIDMALEGDTTAMRFVMDRSCHSGRTGPCCSPCRS
jgi:hypothetical protein